MEHVARRRRPQRSTAAVLTAGVVLSGVLVWQSSDAAFTDTTASPADSWSAGRVEVGEEQPGAALLTGASMAPGTSGARCLVVSYSGTHAAAVRLHGGFEDAALDADADGVADATELAPYVELAIEEGRGDQPDCSDFSATSTLYGSQPFDPTLTATSFTTDVVGHADGLGTWAPATSGSRTFKVSYHLKDHEAVADKDLRLELVWEAARAS